MTPDRLKELAGDPRFIPGIYNYCDRWCERCPFTSRCLNYAMGQESGDEVGTDPEQRDVNNEKFWGALENSLQLAVELIRDDCEKRGIDFAALQRQALAQARAEVQQDRRRRRREHPLVEAATSYLKRVDKWFKAHKRAFKAKGVELESAIRMGLQTDEQIISAARDLQDAVEVIQWYYMFISAKLFRAVRQDDEHEQDPATIPDPEVRQAVIEARDNDATGSAKIALIAIDRSLAAWARVREHMPLAGDGIIDLLVILDRLRRVVEEAFPGARNFIRPGFDDGTPVPQPAPPAKPTRKRRRKKKD